ncbi:MAG: GNAT family N-acetyltransferase [Clostridia bacterium]|nr:GNAT family N-acetyltransferase [Clostridia bacterium]
MIRKANMNDLDHIEEIYNEIHTEIEDGRARIGWTRGVYPARDIAEDSIRRRDMFVMEVDGQVVAAGRINQYQGPEYDEATWSFNADPDDVMVLHTLVVSPRVKGRSYGEAFARFYEDYARQQGCKALRIDTNAINAPARSLYRKLGYTEACIVLTSFNGIDGVNLVCLDKKL